jgi:uncharacterized protein
MNASSQDIFFDSAQFAIGIVRAVNGNSASCDIDGHIINLLREHDDPSIARCGSPGSILRINVEGRALLANLREIRLNAHDELLLTASVDFLGEGEMQDEQIIGFRRGVQSYPRPGDKVFGVPAEGLADAFSTSDLPHIDIGTIYPTNATRASLLIDPMLSMHFAVLGSTGTGKSTTMALVLHNLIHHSPDAHIVIMDPHGEYAKAFPETGMAFNVDNIKIPYWLMNFEEHCQVFIHAEGIEREVNRDVLAKCLLLARSKSNLALSLGAITVDSPLHYQIGDLLDALNQEMGRLEKASLIPHYSRLKIAIEETLRDPRFHFIFDRTLAAASMEDFLARIFRLPAEGRPLSIIDLSGMPTEIIHTVVGLLARITLDFAIWARDEHLQPILLICEEAQRYLSSHPDANNAPVRDALERIAKEGRKYGVSLGLVTQRPSELSETALSQCGTYITLRLNNENDQERIRLTLPDTARGFVDTISALKNRECIISGEGVVVPLRVTLDYLAEELRPKSEDPSYTAAWRPEDDSKGSIERAVRHWRRQGQNRP